MDSLKFMAMKSNYYSYIFESNESKKMNNNLNTFIILKVLYIIEIINTNEILSWIPYNKIRVICMKSKI